MVSDNVKYIYNQYLKSLATQQNRGFRYRKNFDKFEDENVNYCTKIHKLLSSYPHIDIETFFDAPNKLNPETHFPLKYYATYPAMRSYTVWTKQRQNLPPDDPYHLAEIQKSFKFIATYCIQNKIQWDDYLVCDDVVPHWVQHLKQQSITIYALMGYDGLRQEIDHLPNDVKSLYIQNIGDNYIKLKQSFMKSTKAKALVIQGHKRCKKYITQSCK